MAKGYRAVERDQQFLLPPDMREWLPPDHLAWFVIDAVAQLDLKALHARRRLGGAGRQAYDPAMLLAVLIYAYAVGERSSRQIERRCLTDVAFRVLAANQGPDHSTIARFRAEHEGSVGELFGQVLLLCARQGLGNFGRVSVDGSKIAANASIDANRQRQWVREQAARMLAEAAEVDAAEDAEFGAARGDELPEALRDPQARAAAIAAALEEIKHQEEAASGQQGEPGEAPSPCTAERVSQREQRLQALERELESHHAAQALAIAEHERARAAARATGTPIWGGGRPKPETARMRQLAAQLQRARARHEQELRRQAEQVAAAAEQRRGAERLAAQGDEARRVNLTDPHSRLMPTRKGFVQGYNVQFAVTDDQLIVASEVTQNPTDYGAFVPMMQAAQTAAAQMRPARPDTDQASAEAGAEVGIMLADAGYLSVANLTAAGPDRLIAVGKRRTVEHERHHDPASGPPPVDATPIEAMGHRLRTEGGIRDYRRRGATVEPAIGSIKHRLGLRTLSRRGLAAAKAEVNFTALTHNLLKLRLATA